MAAPVRRSLNGGCAWNASPLTTNSPNIRRDKKTHRGSHELIRATRIRSDGFAELAAADFAEDC